MRIIVYINILRKKDQRCHPAPSRPQLRLRKDFPYPVGVRRFSDMAGRRIDCTSEKEIPSPPIVGDGMVLR
ncbi:MAG: hypothetical protein IKZ56_13120 [Bacteroidales bacterium]|nr:hypothetical protein [Bacteroidales bacterium]